MKLWLVLLLLVYVNSWAQSIRVDGVVIDERGLPVKGAEITTVSYHAVVTEAVQTNVNGNFTLLLANRGKYYFTVAYPLYEHLRDSFLVENANVFLGNITIVPVTHVLPEVIIARKIAEMVIKGDTLEFNAGAFLMNKDADAIDLVRKMHPIEINGQRLSVQGEPVVRILVDGKPFFSDDPFATLNILPAEMIDKVQLYSEKSEQEQFTGFNEGKIHKNDKFNYLNGQAQWAFW